ncbi:MAG: cobalamin biosynthesis protein [Rhodobacter sp.]|uniref:cobalamin biosynthesis protein n=1 Tax=Pararhodobacter sp. TaxID=2127056 RepID=UPI001DF20894|nr:cobalamin biosynthesis protein [Pararhodobacter sp.]MCB1345407.1 cobalamin biosynthesis protein [Paracoccaceae bacterium]MCC0072753.1 cobalamin biosynthesis protein [Rhodobacter sp.]HPD90998.1 cobalamin biosynthesis protein [Pararhodobacter sp.]
MIVAGFGFSSRATAASLRAALVATGAAPAALATLADKAGALAPLARALGLPVIAVTGPLPDTDTQSPRSLAARGTGSVAEACALKAAGPGAVLLTPRVTSPDRLATCAIAKGFQE